MWLSDSGAESLLVAMVAVRVVKKLREDFPELCLTVEEHFSEVAAYAKASGAKSIQGNIPSILRKSSRADIVVWSDSETPIAVIELKRAWGAKGAENDIKRLKVLIDRYGRKQGGPIECAIFGSFVIEKGDKDFSKIKDRCLRIQRDLRQNFAGLEVIRAKPYGPSYPDNNRYSAGSVVAYFS